MNGNGTAVRGGSSHPASSTCILYTGNGVKRKLRMRRAAAVRRYRRTIRSGIIFTECVIVKFPSSLVEPFLSGGSVRTRRFDDETKVYHTRTLCHSDPRTKHRPLASPLCCRILLPHTAAAFFCRTASLRTATRNTLPGRVSDTPQKSDAQTLPAGGRRVSDEPPCTPSWWSAANHSHNH